MEFRKYSSLDNFRNFYRDIQTYIEYNGLSSYIKTFTYKQKLHGTNAGLSIGPFLEVYAQKRSSMIDLQNDNAGFAAFVEKIKPSLQLKSEHAGLIFFGEWCGPGIQKGVASSQVSNKFFAIFDIFDAQDNEVEWDAVKDIFDCVDDIYYIEKSTEQLTVDFCDIDSVRSFHKRVEEIAKLSDDYDPWIYKTFGIKGLGEGIVLTSTTNPKMKFKEKVETFKEVKEPKIKMPVDAALVEKIQSFVESVMTEHRLEKAYDVVQVNADIKNMGHFLKYIGNDIERECRAELADLDLTWKQVSGEIFKKGRSWLLKKINSDLEI